MNKFAILFISFFISVSSQAKALTLEQIFTENFVRIYSEGNCSSNIWHLLGIAKENGIDISKASVYFMHLKDLEEIYLQKPRTDKNGWFFHAVLVVEGKVFDFDFTKKPTVLTWSDYHSQQWPPKTEEKSFIRKIPAATYLEKFTEGDPSDRDGGYLNLVFPEENPYPVFKMTDLERPFTGVVIQPW